MNDLTILLILAGLAAAAGWATAAGAVAARRATTAELDRLRQGESARIRFFAHISHELRTPLALVLSQLEAALLEGNDETRSHRLRVAARNARRLQRLADQALELTRLDQGALMARPVQLAVVPYLEGLVLSFGELAERNGIRLDFIATPRSIACPVDPDQLTMIVSNLLSNALRYTPPGGRVGVVVEEKATGPGGGRGWLSITVVDTGRGIPVEAQAAVFEPFVRGPESDRTHPGGAGIGLALASQLARLHGGRIALQSEPGHGARFTVLLPLGREAAPAVPLQLDASARPPVTEEILYRTTGVEEEEAPAEDGRPTILVVEDNADMRNWLASELAPVGQAMTVEDGPLALERARLEVPDLVVTDRLLPGMNGEELCRRLRADERTSHIPIVMLTAYDSVERRVEGLTAGADDYLGKPVDARELRARVNALITRRQALRERFRTQVIVKPSDISAQPADQSFFATLMATIEERLGDSGFSVPQLAEEMAMSTSQLTRKLQAMIHQSPGQLIRSVRLRRAADLIMTGTGNLAEVAYQVGFSDQAHFSRTFKRQFGKSPREYRKEPGARLPPEGPATGSAGRRT